MLEVFDHVQIGSYPPIKGIFLGLDVSGRCVMRRTDGVCVTVPHGAMKILSCKNCRQRFHAHTSGGKCLYGPGEWEVE